VAGEVVEEGEGRVEEFVELCSDCWVLLGGRVGLGRLGE